MSKGMKILRKFVKELTRPVLDRFHESRKVMLYSKAEKVKEL
jgi:hypothetical protein